MSMNKVYVFYQFLDLFSGAPLDNMLLENCFSVAAM